MCYYDETQQRFYDTVYIYKKDAYRIIYSVLEDHHVADELSHVVMINAWNGFSKLKDPSRAKAWVKKITKNVIRQYMSKNRICISETEKDFIDEIEDMNEVKLIERDILDALVEKEDIKTVFAAINSLDKTYRIIIKANLIWHIPLNKLADNMGMNPGTVRVMYSRGIKKLRKAYEILEKGGNLNG